MGSRHLVRYVRLAILLSLMVALTGCSEDPTLRVTRLSRQSGKGGEFLTIYGTGFQSGGAKDVRVFFGQVQGKVQRIKGNTEIVVEIPGGADMMGKTVDLRLIFEPGGELTYPAAFTYAEPAQATVDDLLGGGQK